MECLFFYLYMRHPSGQSFRCRGFLCFDKGESIRQVSEAEILPVWVEIYVSDPEGLDLIVPLREATSPRKRNDRHDH